MFGPTAGKQRHFCDDGGSISATCRLKRKTKEKRKVDNKPWTSSFSFFNVFGGKIVDLTDSQHLH